MIRLLIALVLPWLLFFTIRRPFAGILCIFLHLTIIGWLPAAIWAVLAWRDYEAKMA